MSNPASTPVRYDVTRLGEDDLHYFTVRLGHDGERVRTVRATAVQIQSHLNRMDPRRNRMYNSLKKLLRFWVFMAEKKNPKIPVGDQNIPLKNMIGGFRTFKIIAPEITPRDAQEAVTVEINKVQARLSSLRTSMDNIGTENPESELDLIREEGMDAQLNPERAQAFAALSIQLQQLQMNAAQMQQQLSAMSPQGGAPQGDPNAAAAASQASRSRRGAGWSTST